MDKFVSWLWIYPQCFIENQAQNVELGGEVLLKSRLMGIFKQMQKLEV